MTKNFYFNCKLRKSFLGLKSDNSLPSNSPSLIFPFLLMLSFFSTVNLAYSNEGIEYDDTNPNLPYTLGTPCDGQIKGFQIFDSNNDNNDDIITDFVDGQEFCELSFNSDIRIRALTRGTHESLEFTVLGPNGLEVVNIENKKPYDSKKFWANPGTYTIIAKLYSNPDLGGSICDEKTITLIVIGDTDGDNVCDIDDCNDNDASIYPNAVCDDGNPRTVDDQYDENCNCIGTPLTCVDIDNQDFESSWGIWNDGGSDASKNSDYARYANSGTHCIRLRDNTSSSRITTDNLDLSSYSHVTISFSYIVDDFEDKEDFWLQISTNDGSSFTTVEKWARKVDFQNGQRYNPSVTVNGPFSKKTKFRFRCDASSDSDEVYLDDITISACNSTLCESFVDSDGDGVCSDVDCNDANPNLPATPGTACDDYNPNTENDVIQADGCSCQGISTTCNDLLVSYSGNCDDGPDSFSPDNEASCIHASDLVPGNGKDNASCNDDIICIQSDENYWTFTLDAQHNFTFSSVQGNFYYPIDTNPMGGGSSNSSSCNQNFEFKFKLLLDGVHLQSKTHQIPADEFVTRSFQLDIPLNILAGQTLEIQIIGQPTSRSCDLFETNGVSVYGCCSDPCVNDSPIVTISNETNSDCTETDGAFTLNFPNHPTRTGIEFSIDGGNTYPYNTPDNVGSFTIDNLGAGTYDVYARWGNDECPIPINLVELIVDNPEAIISGEVSSNCGQTDGSFTLNFPNYPTRTNIEFSIDGGNTYPYNTSDDVGSFTIDNLGAGTYDVYARWGNDECPIPINLVELSLIGGSQTPGTACDDYNPNTENDVIQADGCSCQGISTTCNDLLVSYSGNCDDGPDSFSPDNEASCIHASDLVPGNGKDNASCNDDIICIQSDENYWTFTLDAQHNFTFSSVQGNFYYPIDTNPMGGGSSNSSSCNQNFEFKFKLLLDGVHLQSKTHQIPADEFVTRSFQLDIPLNILAGQTLEIQIIGQPTSRSCDLFETNGVSVYGCCSDPCVNDSPIVTISNETNSDCTETDGAFTLNFPNHPTRTGIEFSIDGGNTYPYNTPDNVGSFTIDNLGAGTYDVYARWGNDECPIPINLVELIVDNPEAIISGEVSSNCGQTDGSFTLNFPNYPTRTNIEFSIDGGNTYPYNTSDDVGSFTIDNLGAGTYDVYARWGNDECPIPINLVELIDNSQAPGATCDDANPNTENDVVQADGCSCQGTPVTICDGQITSFQIFDSNNNNGDIITDFVDGQEFCELSFYSDISIRALVNGTHESVEFTVLDPNGLKLFNTQNNEPYGSKKFEANAGTYTVIAKLYKNPDLGGGVCDEKTITLIIIGDSDSDNICDTEDCQPNNPDFPAAPGTTCDDYNPNTENDVVQADGCSCAGVLVESVCENLSFGGKIGFGDVCAGTIEICSTSEIAPLIGNCETPTGGSGAIEYIWLRNEISCDGPTGTVAQMITNPDAYNWKIIPNSNAATYNPGTLSSSTCFLRCSRRTDCMIYLGESNIVRLEVNTNCGNGGGTKTESCGGGTSITYGNGLIKMEGGSFYQIFDAQWQTTFNCGWQCGNSQTVNNLPQGDYRVIIKDQNYQVICEKVISLLAGDGDSDNDNDGIPVSQDCNDNDANLTTVGAACNDGDANTENDVVQANCTCAGTSINTGGGDPDNDSDGIPASQDCNDNDANLTTVGAACNDGDANTENDVIQTNCTCVGTSINTGGGNGGDINTESCGAETSITYGNGLIKMEGGNFYQILDAQWQTIFNCGWQCGNSQTVDNLPSGDYRVIIKDDSYNAICEKVISLTTDSGNIGGSDPDNDNDGIPASQDCNDNDTNLTTVGAACNDGNVNTENDVVQTNCTCAGTPINTGGGGPDNDGDGLPASQDCNDNDANLTTAGAACNDGNVNTENDVVQANCTCVGTPINTGSSGNTESCGENTITYGKGTIAIEGVSGKEYFFKINDLNQGWAQVSGCGWNCGYQHSATELPNSKYLITIYNDDWSQHCSVEIEMKDSAYSGSAGSRKTSRLSFAAYQASQEVELQWLTNSGYKVNNFEVEHSTDGNNFSSIAQFVNKEWSDVMEYHQTIDKQPTEGINYYRVKEIYLDGSFVYTDIQSVGFHLDLKSFSMYPNPTQEDLNFTLSPFMDKTVNISLVNHLGQTVKNVKMDKVRNEHFKLSLGNIPSGFYQVLIQVDGHKPINKKLIVERLY